MGVIMCQACTNIHVCAHHKSSRLPLAVLIEHTEEAIVSNHLPVVIPFLGVTGYLISVVKLESEERIDNLRGGAR
jgi:hypothetical protein